MTTPSPSSTAADIPDTMADYPLPAPTTTANAAPRIGVISRASSRAASGSRGSTNSRSSSRHPLSASSRMALDWEPGPPPSQTPWPEEDVKIEDEIRSQPNFGALTDRRPRRMSELRETSPDEVLENLRPTPGPSSQPAPERGRKRRRIEPKREDDSVIDIDVEIIHLPGEEPPPVASSSKLPAVGYPKPELPPVPTAAEQLSKFNCPICFTPPTRATLMPCGHVCCGECLFASVKTMQRRNQYAPDGHNVNAARQVLSSSLRPLH
jgi:hypothetical protein